MLNKKQFIFIIIFLIALNIVGFIFYKNNKTKLYTTYSHYTHIKQKIDTINLLKNKSQKLNEKILNKYCSINTNYNNINLTCNNLDKKSFDVVSYNTFEKNIKISSFSIIRYNDLINLNIKIVK